MSKPKRIMITEDMFLLSPEQIRNQRLSEKSIGREMNEKEEMIIFITKLRIIPNKRMCNHCENKPMCFVKSKDT